MNIEDTVEVEETLDTQEEEVEEQEEEVEEQEEEVEEQEEDVEDDTDWKAEAEKQKQLAENQKKRAEKAEKKSKTPAPSNDSGMSALDIIAISKADVAEEDLDEVLDYAKYKGISIAEALKSNVVKATLTDNAEHRKSAEAVSTGSTRRGSSQVSDERLLENASNGNLPSSDADMNRLAKLKIGRK